ncbi:unnamed protein product, partial [Polarella glacialis]
VFDHRCWVHAASAAADPDRCNLQDPCRSDCWDPSFSHSYCCLAGSSCWWWGCEVSLASTLREEPARSGPECRHLCQAEPLCAAWSFYFPAAEDLAVPGQCLLLAAEPGVAAAPSASTSSSKSVVSGPRICRGSNNADYNNNSKKSGEQFEQLPPITAAAVVDAGMPGFAREAAGALLGTGWTLLRNALNAQQITALQLAATSAAEDLLSRDPQRRGNRGPRRYSFGGASTTHHMVHLQAWADLMDNEALRQGCQKHIDIRNKQHCN